MNNSEENIVISCDKISKKFKQKYALNNVSFKIPQGEIVGLVGKNGAGKTTLIRILSGIMYPTEGDYNVLGATQKNIHTVLKDVTTMIEHPTIYPDLSAKDNMVLMCQLKGIKNPIKSGYIREKLTFVGLESMYDSKVIAKRFSLGMKQRLGIALSSIGEPKVMLLDEPTNGLDPEGISQIRNLLLKLNQENNTTILISSHILSELEKFATSYMFIKDGMLIKEIKADELYTLTSSYLCIDTSDNQKAFDILSQIYKCDLTDRGINVYNLNEKVNIINLLMKNQISLNALYENKTDIEDYYLELMGGNN